MSDSDRWIPIDPTVRAGMYQSLDQIPEHHRLRVYQNRFEGEDTWNSYLTAQSWREETLSEKRRKHLERTESRWKSFIKAQERHHALCTPADADAYARVLRDEYDLSLDTASKYWGDIERFYRWMFHHTEYPHRYHPFVMAASNYESSRETWIQLLTRDDR